jgi:hypothetical protein
MILAEQSDCRSRSWGKDSQFLRCHQMTQRCRRHDSASVLLNERRPRCDGMHLHHWIDNVGPITQVKSVFRHTKLSAGIAFTCHPIGTRILSHIPLNCPSGKELRATYDLEMGKQVFWEDT